MTTLIPETQAAVAPLTPVAPLGYADPREPWPAEVKLLVGIAIIVALVSLLSSAGELWILFAPGGFKTIGTNLADPNSRWIEWPSFFCRVVAAALMIAGGLQFLAHRRRGRAILLAGALLELIVQLLAAATSVHYRVQAFTSIRAADQILYALWQTQWTLQRMLLPLLLLALLNRRLIRSRFT